MKPFSHTIALLTQSLGSWGSEAGYRCWWLATLGAATAMSFEMKEFIGFVNSRHLSDYMIGGEATILRFVDFGKQ